MTMRFLLIIKMQTFTPHQAKTILMAIPIVQESSGSSLFHLIDDNIEEFPVTNLSSLLKDISHEYLDTNNCKQNEVILWYLPVLKFLITSRNLLRFTHSIGNCNTAQTACSHIFNCSLEKRYLQPNFTNTCKKEIYGSCH